MTDSAAPEHGSGRCAVVVLNWNGLEDTKACIQSLLDQSSISPIIWVIDNASSNNEYEQLDEAFGDHERISLVSNEANLGFAKAHNAVFKQLLVDGYEWIACLNNDAVAQPDWLAKMISCAERENGHMVASKMVQMKNPQRMDNAGHFMLNTGEIIPRGYNEPAEQYTQPFSTLGPCAGACLYHRQVLADLGGFDEHFFVGYEDAELGLRAWLRGFECWFEPEAVVHHRMSVSINRVRSAKYLSEIQSGIFYTWFKLMPASILWAHLPFMIFKYASVLIIDVVFLRFRFLTVMVTALKDSWRQRRLISQARKKTWAASERNRSFIEINQRLRFFLWFDIIRFWKFVILKQQSDLEQ